MISLKIFPLLDEHLNLSGTFFLYCGVVICGLPLVMIKVPETKDLSIHEINNLFRQKNTLLQESMDEQE